MNFYCYIALLLLFTIFTRNFACNNIEVDEELIIFKDGASDGVDDYCTTEKCVVVIGSAALDMIATLDDNNSNSFVLATSNPGIVETLWGGVGRNMAYVTAVVLATFMGESTGLPPLYFISAVGEDATGTMLINYHKSFMHTKGIDIAKGQRSSTYIALHQPDGELFTAVGDMPPLISRNHILHQQNVIQRSAFLVLDANPSIDVLDIVCRQAKAHNIPIWYEPTSVSKSTKIMQSECFSGDTAAHVSITPNLSELLAFAHYLDIDTDSFEDEMSVKNYGKLANEVLTRGRFANIVLTMGKNGVLLASKTIESSIVQHFIAPAANVVSVNQAGDTLAGCMFSLLFADYSLEDSIKFGMSCAKLRIEDTFSDSALAHLKMSKEWEKIESSNLLIND